MNDVRRLPARGWIVVAGVFGTAAGSSMIAPYLVIYLTQHRGIGFEIAALALTAKLWSQLGLAFFGGLLADAVGAKLVMVAGLVVRGLAYVGFALVAQDASVVAWAALLGAGSALFGPASKSALVSIAGEKGIEPVRIFSLQNAALNAGGAIGPLIGFVTIQTSPRTTFLATAAIFVGFGVLTAVALPAVTGRVSSKVLRPSDVRAVAGSRRLWFCAAAYAAFFALYAQLELTVPAYARGSFSSIAVPLVFVVNTLLVLAIQMPVTPWNARTSTVNVMIVAFLCSTVGMGLIGAGGLGVPGLLLGIAAFSVAEVLIAPKLSAAVSAAVPSHAQGTGQGLLSLAGGVGATAGNLLGASLFGPLLRDGRAGTFWLGLSAASLAVAVGLWLANAVRVRAAPRPASEGPR